MNLFSSSRDSASWGRPAAWKCRKKSRAARATSSPDIRAARINDDGRMEVIANVRNRLNRRIEVQVNCVFKDEKGFPTNDEAPFKTLFLDENAQEGVRFISMNNQARTYTIRVREAR